jgi:hypothetical protein
MISVKFVPELLIPSISNFISTIEILSLLNLTYICNLETVDRDLLILHVDILFTVDSWLHNANVFSTETWIRGMLVEVIIANRSLIAQICVFIGSLIIKLCVVIVSLIIQLRVVSWSLLNRLKLTLQLCSDSFLMRSNFLKEIPLSLKILISKMQIVLSFHMIYLLLTVFSPFRSKYTYCVLQQFFQCTIF